MNLPPEPPPRYPSFDLPVEQGPRNFTGWLVLSLILIYLVVSQLGSYLTRDEQKGDLRYLDSVTLLRKAVGLKQSTTFGKELSSQADALLKDVADGLKPDVEKDVVAARLYAAALSEQGKAVPPTALTKLRASKEKRDLVFADVFAAKKLTKVQAADVEQKLKGGGYISTLATAQAWEKAGAKDKRDALLPGSNTLILILAGAGMCGTFFLGIVLWIVYLVGRSQGHWKPVGMPLEHITLADADRLAIRCAQVFGLFLAVPLVVHYAIAPSFKGKLPDAMLSNIGSLILYGLLIGLTLLLFARGFIGGKRISLASIGITTRNLGSNIAWGVSTAIANIPLVLGMAFLGNFLFSWLPKAEHPATVELQTQNDLFTTIALLLMASIGAPILEEIMFRGTMLPALARVLKRPVAAILIQGLVFAAIHPTGIPAWLALATVGAMSGFLTRQTGSLVPSIVMHAVHNFGTLLVAKAALSFFGF